MELRNVTTDAVTAALSKVSAEYGDNITTADGINVTRNRRNGNVNIRLSLRANYSRGRGTRASASGRRGPWVCWHVTRDFLRYVFAECPDAVVATALATYRGTAGFESEFPRTYYTNAGSMMYPANFGSLCMDSECD